MDTSNHHKRPRGAANRRAFVADLCLHLLAPAMLMLSMPGCSSSRPTSTASGRLPAETSQLQSAPHTQFTSGMTPPEVATALKQAQHEIEAAWVSDGGKAHDLEPAPPCHRFTIPTAGGSAMAITATLGRFSYHFVYLDRRLQKIVQRRDEYRMRPGTNIAEPVPHSPQEFADVVLKAPAIPFDRFADEAMTRSIQSLENERSHQDPLPPFLQLFATSGPSKSYRSWLKFINRYDASPLDLGASVEQVESALGAASISTSDGDLNRSLFGDVKSAADAQSKNHVEVQFHEGHAVAIFTNYLESH